MMKIQINEHLQDFPTINYNEVEYFQGELKSLGKENYAKLRNSIESQGLLSPFFVWIHPHSKIKYLIDGHQRKRLFMLEKVEPLQIPYLLIPGETYGQAKMNLLSITSQYGTITADGLKNFAFDIPKSFQENSINFDALSKPFKVEFAAKEQKVADISDAEFYVNIKCKDEAHCQELYEKFIKEGLDVKIVT